MSEGFVVFLLVIFIFLIGFISGLPRTVYMDERDLAYVSNKCVNNKGIDSFTTFSYKVVCKDGAVFEINKQDKEQ